MFLTLIIFLFSVVGFSISLYLHLKKIKNQKVLCPMRFSCDEVVSSKYGNFLGISVSILGMIYYGFVFVLTAIIAVFPLFFSPYLHFVLFLCSFLAILFSVYLSLVETFALKRWCSWCLLSSFITFIIFIFVFIKTFVYIVPIVLGIKGIVLIIHVLSVISGFGGAILTDFFFFKFLDDKKITIEESRTMNMISEIIWFSVGVLIVSGFLLYLPQSSILNESPRFITKVIGVAIIVLNGALLSFVVSPYLGEINFATTKVNEKKKIFLRKLSFALGSVSMSSWLVVFVLGYVKELDFSLAQFLFGYFFIIVVAVASSLLMDFLLSHKSVEENTFAK